MSLVEQAMPYIAAAVREYGAAVLATAPDAGMETAAGLGRRLLWEVFGTQTGAAVA